MDGVTLTDAQVALLTDVIGDIEGWRVRDADGSEFGPYINGDEIESLAREVQEYRALRSVMAAAVRDVNAGMLKPYDALAHIVAELASLDSRAVADGH
jgi:hypothetical protein